MSKPTVDVRINKQWDAALRKEMRKRLRRAAVFLEGKVKESINKPTRRFGPSPPGMPPHRDTGQLWRSIFSELEENQNEIWAYIGSSVEHGKFHELGKRPFLKSALLQHRRELIRILRDGK